MVWTVTILPAERDVESDKEILYHRVDRLLCLCGNSGRSPVIKCDSTVSVVVESCPPTYAGSRSCSYGVRRWVEFTGQRINSRTRPIFNVEFSLFFKVSLHGEVCAPDTRFKGHRSGGEGQGPSARPVEQESNCSSSLLTLSGRCRRGPVGCGRRSLGFIPSGPEVGRGGGRRASGGVVEVLVWRRVPRAWEGLSGTPSRVAGGGACRAPG